MNSIELYRMYPVVNIPIKSDTFSQGSTDRTKRGPFKNLTYAGRPPRQEENKPKEVFPTAASPIKMALAILSDETAL